MEGLTMSLSLGVGEGLVAAQRLDDKPMKGLARFDAAALCVLGVLETILAVASAALTYLIRNSGKTPKKWNRSCDLWSQNASNGTKNAWKIAWHGKGDHLKAPVELGFLEGGRLPVNDWEWQ